MSEADVWETVPDTPLDKSMFWNPSKNDTDPRSIEGEVIEKKEGKFGTDVVLNTSNGKKQTPSHKQLQSKLEKVSEGQYIKVTLVGEKKSGKGNPTKIYEVSIRKNYQSQITQNSITDPAGLIHRDLLTAPSGLLDAPFWELVRKHTKTFGEGAAIVDKLKAEGRIFQKDGAWRAVV